jgi:hypothetical protein
MTLKMGGQCQQKIINMTEVEMIHQLLANTPRSVIRHMASIKGVELGKDKCDTINNLILAGCIKLKIEYVPPKPEYKARVVPPKHPADDGHDYGFDEHYVVLDAIREHIEGE